MNRVIGIEEAQAKLKAIISQLGPNDEVVITDNDRPIARLVSTGNAQPKFGSCRGMLAIVQDDDDHLADFSEYLK